MTFDDFLALDPARAHELPAALAALALDRAGSWEASHERAQSESTPETNRVHAYLHRKEGDEGNARYWYGRVGEAPFDGSLEDEWRVLAVRFLG